MIRTPKGAAFTKRRACFFACALWILGWAGIAIADDTAMHGEDEHALLHLKLDLNGVRRWVGDTLSAEPLPAKKPLLVVHLFSLDCPPCLKELPKLKELFRAGMPDIEFALVLETLDSVRIRDFLNKNRESLPEVNLYLSTDQRLRGTAQLNMETVPITLLVDENRVVRQAFVGSLEGRFARFGVAMHRLLRAIKHHPESLDASADSNHSLQSGDWLHRAIPNLYERHLPGHAEKLSDRRPGRDVQVLYLFGAGCRACAEDLDGRLRRIIQGFGQSKDVRFTLLDCGADATRVGAGSKRMPLAAPLLQKCSDSVLRQIWANEQRPITLLIDSEHVIRDVFVGSTRSNVGMAIRRLLGSSR